MEFYSAIKKNEILSFTSKWIEQENITFSEVSLRKPKATGFLSYMEYRPITNTIYIFFIIYIYIYGIYIIYIYIYGNVYRTFILKWD
jgi:hypothetical protein